jgi:hypothetical protein
LSLAANAPGTYHSACKMSGEISLRFVPNLSTMLNLANLRADTAFRMYKQSPIGIDDLTRGLEKSVGTSNFRQNSFGFL